MVAIMAAAISREKVASNITSTKFAMDIPSKLNNLRQLKLDFSRADSLSLSELLPPLLELHSDRSSPVRKFIAEIAGDVGLKYTGLLTEIVPVLIKLLKDGTPAVARQAIKCGIDLFRRTLVEVAVKGLYSSELDDSLESAWVWVLKLKDEICSIAFQPESDGRRLLALKFVEVITLLYTTDPSGPSEPPAELDSEGKFDEFNVSWLRGGHPVLNVGDLSVEASQNLALLLDQLRSPTVKSQSNLVIIVLISSLSAIAKKRPAFYGRILPVLLGLDPLSSATRGLQVSGVQYALRKAFHSCLKCTHPGAAPWRDRLAVALREMKVGGLTEQVLHQDSPVNGSIEWKKESPVVKEEKPSSEVRDAVPVSSIRKRSGLQDANDMIEDDDTPGKRARKTETDRSIQASIRDHGGSSSSGTTSKVNTDNGPVQQLVAMFGALVAQGEKAAGSLEILISSISADLLAEVLMANMRHLPPIRPKTEADELLRSGSDTQFKNLSSFLAGLFSPSCNMQKTDSLFNAASEDHEMQKPEEDEYPAATPTEIDVPCSSPSSAMEPVLLPAGLPVSSEEFPSVVDVGLTIPSEISDVGALENEIPGLESSVRSDGLQEIPVASSLLSAELEDTSQEQASSLGRSSLDVLPSISTDRSEELSPKTTLTEATSINSSTDTSSWLSSHVVLPKMSAPVIGLADEQKDQIQNLAFMRIIEAYKQIAVSGGSQLRFSLLAYLGVEFPLELDPWKLLQKHILADYVNHQGHELTLRVLYRLFGEAEADRDFFSSTTATSVYEMFLLAVAETLRDSFPATDKSLSKLLSEVPYLPKSVLKLLECLCSPGSSDKDEELHSGERVHQGLSIVWGLILLRPPIRDVSLKIVLQSAAHHLEEVRMKAIRLVANKLYPIPSISPQIEDFAKETLLSAMNVDLNIAKPGADGSNSAMEKDLESEKPSNECPSSVSGMAKDTSSESGQLSASESVSPTSVTDAKRCMSLYFALCTKKHLLFREVFVIYKNMSKAAKQAVHNEIPKLVRTIGSSSQLLEIISDPPAGSENLLTQVLQTLTDGTIPSPELVATIKKLYDTKVKDAEILIPVLPFLPKDEVLQIFPHIVKLQLDKFQLALGRILAGSSQSGPVLTPAEVLIAIHVIDPERDGIPLKKVTDACNTCFEQRQIFTQQVLAKVLNQLVEQIPLPLLFMRTVLQAIGAFPSLVEFIMEILSRLVSKQIWKYPKLWVGFLKCAQLTKPQSFSVLLQLPPAQLENALNRIPALKAPLVAHANQPHIRSSLPRSVLTVLGIAMDSQTASQGQTTPSQTASQGQTTQSQTASQGQTTQSQTASQGQTTQSQTGDTGNSDKEVTTEKPKESSSAS